VRVVAFDVLDTLVCVAAGVGCGFGWCFGGCVWAEAVLVAVAVEAVALALDSVVSVEETEIEVVCGSALDASKEPAVALADAVALPAVAVALAVALARASVGVATRVSTRKSTCMEILLPPPGKTVCNLPVAGQPVNPLGTR
ncbi:MAG: hypothetical protein AAB701_02055, partial [Patescibacteria group bacterium]